MAKQYKLGIYIQPSAPQWMNTTNTNSTRCPRHPPTYYSSEQSRVLPSSLMDFATADRMEFSMEYPMD